LKAAIEKYLLDSQKKAKNYKGKDVKKMGTLDKTRKLIHVQKIEVVTVPVAGKLGLPVWLNTRFAKLGS
jgi:hypothetical protein